ncbi:oligogalacturonate lyase family protein [Roseateles sp. SL47]|uniref:oligogalacturonate lyase family protein n=1 Tax=Roseateles sp. SL47 TaxID=2995138 RepID=UPI002270CC1D|nr:oligogalacturonate lyase family protein [Roseateles sp. SL47]WAC71499.1 oligogalacturonate lyase family protein [Roseateles sp. SL47]
MKANERQLRFVTRQDPDTGARVTRLTPTDVTCHRNYFYQKAFTNDGKRLIFGAEFGPGSSWNYHLLDLESQVATQLTDQPGENTFGGFLSPDDRHLYFVRAERQLIRLQLADLSEEVVYRVPEAWVGYGTWVANSACTRMVGIEIAASDWFPLSDWQKFHQMFHAKPRCRLIRIDLATGEREVILEQQGWLGHPQYRPFDDQTVAYCHEGPHDLVDARMWFINEDGTHIRCGRQQDPGESCTHEFWVPDGSAMIYVSYLKGQRDRWICSLDPVTLESRRLMHMPPCSHLMSNHDGSLLIGDGCDSPADVADASSHQIKTDPYLHVFDMKAGTERRVARHDSSWRVYKGNRQVTHPHPSFTPDERQVLFSADAEGEPALYLADL